MSSINASTVTSPTYSRQVIADTPARALAFLAAVGTSSAIRAALTACGYSPDDHREGWALLNKASGQHVPVATPGPDARVAEAIASLETWNEVAFRRLRAALDRLHPAQGAFVFEGLVSGRGAQAVTAVGTFLRRLDALDSSADRKADHAALETIARRGATKAERTRLRALVHLAESPPEALVQSPEDIAAEQRDLIALRAWYNDWSETARTVITSRHELIRLGLAKRKSRKMPAPPPVVVVPPVAPPANPVTPVPSTPVTGFEPMSHAAE